MYGKYEKIFAIGDIHGEFEKLVSLLDVASILDIELYVFLGDYIDRGKQSRQVIDFLLEFQKTNKCIFLRGNHEQMCLDYLIYNPGLEPYTNWIMNGGEDTLNSYSGFGYTITKQHL